MRLVISAPVIPRAVLQVVPQLRGIVYRALSSSPICRAVGEQRYAPDRNEERASPPHFPGPSRPPRRTSDSIRGPARSSADSRSMRSDGRWSDPRPRPAGDTGRPLPSSSKRLADLPRRSTQRNGVNRPDGPSPSASRVPVYRRNAGTGQVPPDILKALEKRSGSSPTASPTNEAAKPQLFSSFPLNSALLDKLPDLLGSPGQDSGATCTMPIQSLALGKLLETPCDALLAAETGSGKTLAYVLPLMHHLKLTDPLAEPIPSDSQMTSPSTRPDLGNTSSLLLPRSLVISPTHELTRQSTAVLKSLAHGIKLSVMGLSNTKESSTGGRAGGVDVLLGTSGSMRRALGLRRDEEEGSLRGPGRRSPRETRDDDGVAHAEDAELDKVDKVDREERGKKPEVGLGRVEWVVIDEADVLLGPDFMSETTRLLSLLPPSTRLLLVTATLPPSLLLAISTHPELSKRDTSQLLAPGLHRLPQGVKTRFVGDTGGNLAASVVKEVQGAFMQDALEQRAGGTDQTSGEGSTRAVVFCNTDHRAREVARKFRDKQPALGVLEWTTTGVGRIRGSQGELAPFLRPRTQSASPSTHSSTPTAKAEGDVAGPRVLITTSLLSRGLDFNKQVRTVVLVDPPRDTLDFVHRAGRTGRAGRGGRVIIFGMGEGVRGPRGIMGRGGVGKGMAGVLKGRR